MEDTTKKCGKCQELKPFSDFNKSARGTFGLHGHCRPCAKALKDKWNLENKSHIKDYYMNPDNYTRAKRNAKERYHADQAFREKMLKNNRERRRKEPAKIRQRANEKLRREINPSYRIRANCNSRLQRFLKGLYLSKTCSITELVGKTMDEFAFYIESKWATGMNWENYGKGSDKWHIDHIVPCCSFDLSKQEEQKRCYHYSNLQPLWEKDNLIKGAKLPNGTDARVFGQTKALTNELTF